MRGVEVGKGFWLHSASAYRTENVLSTALMRPLIFSLSSPPQYSLAGLLFQATVLGVLVIPEC